MNHMFTPVPPSPSPSKSSGSRQVSQSSPAPQWHFTPVYVPGLPPTKSDPSINLWATHPRQTWNTPPSEPPFTLPGPAPSWASHHWQTWNSPPTNLNPHHTNTPTLGFIPPPVASPHHTNTPLTLGSFIPPPVASSHHWKTWNSPPTNLNPHHTWNTPLINSQVALPAYPQRNRIYAPPPPPFIPPMPVASPHHWQTWNPPPTNMYLRQTWSPPSPVPITSIDEELPPGFQIIPSFNPQFLSPPQLNPAEVVV
jgi:hypothetical protein